MKTLQKVLCAASISTLLFFTAGMQKSSAQLITGGDLSVNFVNGINIDLAPIIGYKIQKFSAGFSPFIRYGTIGSSPSEISFGARIFGEYDIINGFIVHAEAQVLNSASWSNGLRLQPWSIGIPIGAGYERELYKGVWLKTMVLWDPLQNINFTLNSPNSNPQVRGGITYVF
jgi:hypothetical protein